MNGFGSPDDKDTCDCTFGQSCTYHAEPQKRSARETEQQMRAEGWDPNAQVDGLEEVLISVALSTALSEDKKRRIRSIIFGP